RAGAGRRVRSSRAGSAGPVRRRPARRGRPARPSGRPLAAAGRDRRGRRAGAPAADGRGRLRRADVAAPSRRPRRPPRPRVADRGPPRRDRRVRRPRPSVARSRRGSGPLRRTAGSPGGDRSRRGRGADAGAPHELPCLGPLPPARGQRPERDLRRRRRARARLAPPCAPLARRDRRARRDRLVRAGRRCAPSVIRAGIAGALGSLAWLSARQRDRWHFLLVGALVLLAWSPYNLLDPGFQLSFAAVVAIFVAVPKAKEFFAGYPLPRGLPEVLAVSLACGIATAPILWLQFGRIPVYSVPANALAAPISPAGASLIAHVNGWCAAYLAGCARVVGGLPGATVSSWPAATSLLLLSSFAAGAVYLNLRRR